MATAGGDTSQCIDPRGFWQTPDFKSERPGPDHGPFHRHAGGANNFTNAVSVQFQ